LTRFASADFYLHYSFQDSKTPPVLAAIFIRWNTTQPSGMRHPGGMGVQDKKAFLNAMVGNCKTPTQNTTKCLLQRNFCTAKYWILIFFDLWSFALAEQPLGIAKNPPHSMRC
jgi:hypothetical protein